MEKNFLPCFICGNWGVGERNTNVTYGMKVHLLQFFFSSLRKLISYMRTFFLRTIFPLFSIGFRGDSCVIKGISFKLLFDCLLKQLLSMMAATIFKNSNTACNFPFHTPKCAK